MYKARVVSTLVHGSEFWTLCSREERRRNSVHMRCLRRILVISWRDKVTQRSARKTMFTVLKQRHMRWLSYVRRMEYGRIPKDLLYGELVTGKRPSGHPQLRYKDTRKRDLNTDTWETAAADRSTWKQEVHKGLSRFEENLTQKAEERRSRRKTWLHADRPATTFTCGKCHRERHSRIGLLGHTRRC